MDFGKNQWMYAGAAYYYAFAMKQNIFTMFLWTNEELKEQWFISVWLCFFRLPLIVFGQHQELQNWGKPAVGKQTALNMHEVGN